MKNYLFAERRRHFLLATDRWTRLFDAARVLCRLLLLVNDPYPHLSVPELIPSNLLILQHVSRRIDVSERRRRRRMLLDRLNTSLAFL